MSTLFIGNNKIELPSVDSTNNFAANLIKETNVLEGTVIMSESQTKGRGQSGNTWQSAPGDNLTLSYILKPEFLPLNKQFYLSIITSLSIAKVLHDLNILPIIKWPNDILIGSRKVAGILIENSVLKSKIKYSIIGIGFNVNQTSFETGLKATSVANVTGQIQVKDKIRDMLNSALEGYYMMLKSGKYDVLKEIYLEKLYRFNQEANFTDAKGNPFTGKIIDVSDEGPVAIQINKEVKHFYFKEIVFA